MFIQKYYTVAGIYLFIYFNWTSDLYLTTTHNSHRRRAPMPSAGFEPAIPASERPKTHALDRAATGIGLSLHTQCSK